MKKIVVLLILTLTIKGHAQFARSMFSKDPVINLENFQKQRVYFGFYLGFNSYDFKIDYNRFDPDQISQDILVKKSTGFNVGLVADLKLQEYKGDSDTSMSDFASGPEDDASPSSKTVKFEDDADLF